METDPAAVPTNVRAGPVGSIHRSWRHCIAVADVPASSRIGTLGGIARRGQGGSRASRPPAVNAVPSRASRSSSCAKAIGSGHPPHPAAVEAPARRSDSAAAPGVAAHHQQPRQQQGHAGALGHRSGDRAKAQQHRVMVGHLVCELAVRVHYVVDRASGNRWPNLVLPPPAGQRQQCRRRAAPDDAFDGWSCSWIPWFEVGVQAQGSHDTVGLLRQPNCTDGLWFGY